MSEKIKDRIDNLASLVTKDDKPDPVQAFMKKHYKLPANPFPPSGIADITEENPPLRSNITDEILNFIESSYRSKDFYSMIVTGDYGTGKTHTLRFIEKVVNTNMNKGDHSARAIYVERPRIEANELNRAILRSLGYDTARKYVWFVIREEIASDMNNETERFKRLRSKLTIPKKTSSLWNEADLPITPKFGKVFSAENLIDHRNFLAALEANGWDPEQIRFYLTECLVSGIGEEVATELAEVFVALLLAKDEKSFASWETLVSISKPKLRVSLRAPTFLEFLLRIMRRNGVAYVYLLLDEFEEVPQGNLLSSRQRQEYLYTMREVFDKIRKGLSVVIAITPGAFMALAELATPLSDRNHLKIDLPPTELNDAVRLIQFYLDLERKGSQINVKKGTLQPLSRDLIAYALHHFPVHIQKTPRSLIQFFHRLLDHAARNQIKKIDEDVERAQLAEFGAMKPQLASKRRT